MTHSKAVSMAQTTVAHLEQAGITRPQTPLARRRNPATYDSGYYSEAAASAVEQKDLIRTWPRAVNDTMLRG